MNLIKTFMLASAMCLSACSLPSGEDIKELNLVIEGPASVPPGMPTSGFRATLTGHGGQAVEGAFVSISPSSGTVDVPPDRPGTNGADSDGTGRVDFALDPPSNITTATTIKITAHAKNDGLEADATYTVAVRPDAFQFTQPLANSTAIIGDSHAMPLQFQWIHTVSGQTSGVGGQVQLTANGNGYFVVQGNAFPVGQAISVSTDAASSGQFSQAVAIAGKSQGVVSLSAVDTTTSERKANLTVQFVDTPTMLNLDVDALTVKTAPDTNRFATFTATVLNKNGQPVTGIEVRFSLAQAAAADSVNERLFPTGGITGQDGTATTKYEAGTAGGTVIVKACVADNSICSQRQITVQAPTTTTTTTP